MMQFIDVSRIVFRPVRPAKRGFFTRGRSVADRWTHNPEAAGSSPALATISRHSAGQRLARLITRRAEWIFLTVATLGLGGRLFWATLDLIGGVQ